MGASPIAGAGRPVDVLLVSLGATGGLRRADDQLAAAIARAGASLRTVRARPPREVRTLMLTDLAWARAARHAALPELGSARAVIYSSTTAALLWPGPGAIRFDAPAVGNRPGRHGLWQRPLERRRLRQAPLLLPWSQGGLAETGQDALLRERSLVLPIAVEGVHGSGDRTAAQRSSAERDIAALTYGANPHKKGLDRILAAWARARRAEELLLVAGIDQAGLRRAGLELPEGARATGMLEYEDYRSLLRRTRVFLCAPRREDYGITQLEALADGCRLVTTRGPGPYVALPIAERLDPRLVGEDLAAALRTALDDPLPYYGERAFLELDPFRPEAVQRLVAERLLPALLR